jgi:hypothetical protein
MLAVYVHNIKTLDNISDYEYVVMVNARKIAQGTVQNHDRANGWKPLVRKVINDKNMLTMDSDTFAGDPDLNIRP